MVLGNAASSILVMDVYSVGQNHNAFEASLGLRLKMYSELISAFINKLNDSKHCLIFRIKKNLNQLKRG